jgi:two-component system, OmpR family, response regulator
VKANQSSGQAVLIVDDEQDICYLLGGMLKKRNLDPFFANTLTDAEKMLKYKNPALLFLDNRLPDGFGLDFIPFIKKNFPDDCT